MSQPTFGERARASFRRLARRVPDPRIDADVEQIEPDLPETSLPHLQSLIDSCLLRRRSVVVSRARAAQLAETYARLTREGKQRFFTLLATEYGTDRVQVSEKVAAWSDADEAERAAAERKLRQALIPAWTEVLLALAALPQGVKFVVDMRADLREFRKTDETLNEFDKSLRVLLADWFEVGFVELRELTWTDTPAEVLERLIAY